MKNKMKLKIVLPLVAVALVLASCATNIPLQVQRTPTLDTLGIQRIAVMPFQVVGTGTQGAANHATTVAAARIAETNHFTMVSPQQIQTLRQQRQSIETHVDALFVGQITHVGHQTTSRQVQTTNRQTGVTTTHTVFDRVVEVQFNYGFERARDGSLIGPVSRSGRRTASANSQGELPSVESMVNQIITGQLAQLARDVAPHTVTVRRTLEREPNRDLRPQMDAALAHVRSGSHRLALDAYLNIYQNHGSIAAAMNAAILFEALGETQAAADFMQGVFAATGNPRVRDRLAVLNRELQEMGAVGEFAEVQAGVVRVANHTLAEVQRVLPPNPRVWIHNNATTNQNLLNDVVDNLTSALLRNNITVVDRDSINLIMAEQNFQMQGNVNDNDFVNIGNLAGASTIIIINVTGVGHGRRLQVRVLDIERGVPILQSDTGESWML